MKRKGDSPSKCVRVSKKNVSTLFLETFRAENHAYLSHFVLVEEL